MCLSMNIQHLFSMPIYVSRRHLQGKRCGGKEIKYSYCCIPGSLPKKPKSLLIFTKTFSLTTRFLKKDILYEKRSTYKCYLMYIVVHILHVSSPEKSGTVSTKAVSFKAHFTSIRRTCLQRQNLQRQNEKLYDRK